MTNPIDIAALEALRPQEEPSNLKAMVEARKARQAALEGEISAPRTENTEPQQNTFEDERPCKDCQQLFQSRYLLLNGREIMRVNFCQDCCKKREEQYAREEAERSAEVRALALEARWKQLCPPRYAEPFEAEKMIASVRADLRKNWKPEMEEGIRALVAKVLAHPYGEIGLGAIGPSGHAKTRLIFALLRRYLYEGLACEYINLAVFGREIGARFSRGGAEANAWIEKLCKVPVLFLDDVGKEKMTERVETELYGIVEMRSAHLLPIYFTANVRGADLIKKMTVTRYGDDGETEEISDRAVPIVRRLREFCEAVTI